MIKKIKMGLLDVLSTYYNDMAIKGVKPSIFNFISRYRRRRANGTSWIRSVLWCPIDFLAFDLFLNFFMNFLVLGLLSGRSILPIFTGSLDRTNTPDRQLSECNPPKMTISPSLNHRLNDDIYCDGEFLILRNQVPIIKAVLVPAFVITFSIIIHRVFETWHYIDTSNYIFLCFIVFLLINQIPDRSFILFNRRAQSATFYRGWLFNPITLTYKDVIFTYTNNDSTTGDKVLAVTASKKPKYSLGRLMCYTSAGDKSAMAGAIEYFMQTETRHTLPRALYNSIQYHKHFNETLWRLSWFKKPTAEQLAMYQREDSYYSIELADPNVEYFKFGSTPQEIVNENIKIKERIKSNQEYKDRENRKKDVLPVLQQLLNPSLKALESKFLSDQDSEILQEYSKEINSNLSLRLRGLRLKSRNKISSISENEKLNISTKYIRKATTNIREVATEIDIEKDISSISQVVNDISKNLILFYQAGLFEDCDIADIFSSLTEDKDHHGTRIDELDWREFIEVITSSKQVQANVANE